MDTHHDEKSVVLIVEDEWLIRQDAAGILENSGFEVLQAADAEEALDVLSQRSDAALLFTDVNLPGRNGIYLVQEVHRRWPHIRALITSALQAPAGEVASSERFISKPYGPRTVVEAVNDLLDRTHH